MLQQGAHVDLANATHHMAHYVKTWRHNSQNRKYMKYCIVVTEDWAENFVKFGHAIFDMRVDRQTLQRDVETLVAIFTLHPCTGTKW